MSNVQGMAGLVEDDEKVDDSVGAQQIAKQAPQCPRFGHFY